MQQSALQNYLQVLRRQAFLIVLVPVLAGSLAWFVSSRQTPVYRSSMSIFVAQAGGGFQPVLGSQSLSQTMSNLLESDIVARQAINDLNLNTTPDKLTKKLKVSFKPDSSVLDVSFDSTDKQLGVAVLGRIADAYTRLVDRELGVRSGGGARNTQPLSIIVAKVFDPPHLQKARVSPKPAKNLGFGIGIGLVLGIILGVARESLDDRVRDRRDAEEWFGASVIGALPKAANGNAPPAVTGERRRGHEALMESLYALRANLEFSQDGMSGPKVLITSGGEGEGKTTVAAHMAVTLALAGKDVICVEADLRRPELHRYLGLDEDTPGLVNVIDGDLDLEDALQTVELTVRPWVNGKGKGTTRNKDLGRTVGATLGVGSRGSLRVLTMGRTPEDPANLLATDALKSVFEKLAASADYVIVDAPPLPIADAYPLVHQADNVLVVAKQGWTKRQMALAVRETLEGLGAAKVAVVLTDSSTAIRYG
jgi:succinoglycan biosynthesis transport protein ExoP